MVTNNLHIYWMVAFSVHIIRFVLRRSFYPHMRTSYTTNCTGEASDFEQASLDFISLVSCWGKLNEIVYFAGKSLCNSKDDSTNSWFIVGQERVADYFKKTSRRQESQGGQNLFFRRQQVASSCRGINFFWQQVHDDMKTFSPKPIPGSEFVFSVTLQRVDFSAIDSTLSRITEIT